MKRPDITKEKIQEMLNFGLSYADIAREFGVSRQLIRQKYLGYELNKEYNKIAQKKWRDKIKAEQPEKYREIRKLAARKYRAKRVKL